MTVYAIQRVDVAGTSRAKENQLYGEHWEGLSNMPDGKGNDHLVEIIFKPGTRNIRERLHWASGRQTTRIEDLAYRLFGIFDGTLPIAYWEGDWALYRLMEFIEREWGIFAWAGTPFSHGRTKAIAHSLEPLSHTLDTNLLLTTQTLYRLWSGFPQKTWTWKLKGTKGRLNYRGAEVPRNQRRGMGNLRDTKTMFAIYFADQRSRMKLPIPKKSNPLTHQMIILLLRRMILLLS